MHLIPQSWSHFHILVSVFPSVGLIFTLGLYVGGIVANNEALKRTCLLVLIALALLTIPTYMSGNGANELLENDPKTSQALQDLIDTHYAWSTFAIGFLALTGLAAAYALLRVPKLGRVSENSLHTVLGLGLISLIFMAWTGEDGWEIAHHELQNPGPFQIGVSTPQWWSHIHIILNHFPTIGLTIALGFYIIALAINNDGMKKSALILFVICGVLGVPTYVTGAAAMWALTVPPNLGISKALINEHRDMALLTLFGLGFTGAAAWITLWVYRYVNRFSNLGLYLTLVFAIITEGIMAETGHRGGQIDHPEIRLPGDVIPTDPNAGWSPAIELAINQVPYFVPWQTMHFIGYSLIFGTVLAFTLRVLGFWKSVPFSAVHRVLPLGVFGVLINVFSGMLMMMADTYRYVVTDTTFGPKMALIPIGVMGVLYFSSSNRIWTIKGGEDAPMSAKWVAALVLAAWTGVIAGGRLLPYL